MGTPLQDDKPKKIRPWVYFVLFILGFGLVSSNRTVDLYFQYFSFGAMIVLSAITLWRWWTHASDPTDVGFGMANLPLPRTWKRWMYDEPKKPKSPAN